jgi:uncharacterized protein (DUF736 family)
VVAQTTKGNIMIIGSFTYDKQDKQYSGSIHTLSAFRRLFQPVEKTSDGSPDFRIVLPDPNGLIELGAAWKRIDKNKKEYLSVLLDDPAYRSDTHHGPGGPRAMIPRIQTGSSFKGVGLYYLHDKKREGKPCA